MTGPWFDPRWMHRPREHHLHVDPHKGIDEQTLSAVLGIGSRAVGRWPTADYVDYIARRYGSLPRPADDDTAGRREWITALTMCVMLGDVARERAADERARRYAERIERARAPLPLAPVAPADERPRIRYAPGADPRQFPHGLITATERHYVPPGTAYVVTADVITAWDRAEAAREYEQRQATRGLFPPRPPLPFECPENP